MAYGVFWDYDPDNPNPHEYVDAGERFDTYAEAERYGEEESKGPDDREVYGWTVCEVSSRHDARPALAELLSRVEAAMVSTETDQLAMYAYYALRATGSWEEACALPLAELRRLHREDDWEHWAEVNGETVEGFENDEGALGAYREVLGWARELAGLPPLPADWEVSEPEEVTA